MNRVSSKGRNKPGRRYSRYSYRGQIKLANPSLAGLANSVRILPLGVLHLHHRSIRALGEVGIDTIGKLVEKARSPVGIVGLPAAGVGTYSEINEALRALSRSVKRNRNADWLKYARRRGFDIVPANVSSRFSICDFLRVLPEVLESAVRSKLGPAAGVILREHLLHRRRAPTSLRQISPRLGSTHQGASLVKKKLLQLLRETIFYSNYCGCRFRFHPEFVKPLHLLRAGLANAKGRAISHVKWEKYLAKVWGVKPAQLAPLEFMVLSLLGFEILKFKRNTFYPIILRRGRKTAFRAVLMETERLLSGNASELSIEDSFGKLQRAKAEGGPTLSEMHVVIESIPPQRRHKPARIGRIRRIGNELESILRERGSPMYRLELKSKIAASKRRARMIRKVCDVETALSTDSRFKPIGRIGLWTLTEWKHIETGTVAEVAANYMRKRSGPITEQELYEFISARRPVRKGSIRTLLWESGMFRRIAAATWELKRGA